MKSRFMKAVGLVLALALMLTNVAPLTAYAATKDAASLKKGDKLKPGDVLTYDGYIDIGTPHKSGGYVSLDGGYNSITILNSYHSVHYAGEHYTNLKVDYIEEVDNTSIYTGESRKTVYIDVTCSRVKKTCNHGVCVDNYCNMLGDHNRKCVLCAKIIYCSYDMVDGVCHKCGYGTVTKAPVAEPTVPEAVTPAVPEVTAPVVDTTSFASVFNSTYYADANPDLKAVFGNDEALLLNHFLTCGMAEGRLASAEFNVHVYKANNADLRAVFGEDLASYYHHYINNGKAEGRVAK